LREIVAYGVPLIPHSIGYFFLSSVDRFVINVKLGPAEVGIYMAAAQLAAGLSLVFDAINSAYVPWLFERLKRNEAQEKRQIVRSTYLYFLALAGVVALAFTLAPSILVLVAGQKYAAGAKVISWLILGWVLHGMYLMVTNYVFFSKRTGLLSLSTITAGLLNVGLLLVLVPYFGLRGAAIAFAISSALKLVLTWCAAQRSHPMPWFDFQTATR
jgi:O-antigen/teichoic acid export membrane protein